MSISSTNRKAGPYPCNGATVAFPFAFKVFAAADVRVVLTDADGGEIDLVLGSGYTVALNSDQDTSPGGTVTTVATYATGYLVTLTSQLQNLQPVVLTNVGGFYPRVINDALDRVTILVQQLGEQVGRAVKVGISSVVSPDALMAQLSASVASAFGYSTAAAGSASDAADSAAQAASSAADAAAAAAGATDASNLITGTIPDARFPATLPSGVTVPAAQLTGTVSIPVASTSSAAIGYGIGAGSTVTQATDKFTAVTLNKPSGRITMNAAALASGASANFILNNNALVLPYTVSVNIVGGVSDVRNYNVSAGFNSNGSVQIILRNLSGGALSEAAQIQFNVLQGATT